MSTLPEDIIAGDPGHIAHHDQIHAFINDPPIGGGGGGGGGLVAADYTIYKDAGVAYAVNGQTGATDFSDADPAVVMQSVLTSFSPDGGTVVVKHGSYNWDSVPAIPPNTTRWIRIIGEEAIIQLSSTGRRFLDFGRLAPGDTFNFIHIEGFTVNANALAGLTGTQHIVIGNFQNPTTISGQDVNFDNIVIRKIRTINVATAIKTVRHYLNIFIQVFATNNATQYQMTNILVEQCHFDGGNYGVGIVGGSQSGFADNPDVWQDNIIVRDIVHDTNVPPTGSSSFAHVHLGGRAKGGTCWVYNINGKNSWDVGVEVDDYFTAFIHDVHLENWYGFGIAITNFMQVDRGRQIYYVTNITGYRNSDARWSTNASALIGMNQAKDLLNVDQQFGKVYATNIHMRRAGTNLDLGAMAGDLVELKNPVKEFSLRNATYQATGLTHGVASSIFERIILVLPTHSDGSSDVTNHMERIVFRDIDMRLVGSTFDVGSSSMDLTGIYLSGLIDSFLIDNLRYEVDITNVPADAPKGIHIGQAGAGLTTTQGRINGCQFKTTSPVANRAIIIEDTTKLTIPTNTGIWITDCDFSGLSATGTEISHPGAGDQKDQTFVDNNKWKTFPKVAYAITVVTGVANRFLDGWDATFILHGGVNVTQVQISRDGATWYTIASAPGTNTVTWPMHHGEYWQVDFTGGGPALHVFPEN